MKVVNKVWGREVWIANNNMYCGKILELNSGWSSSYHYHRMKQETFYCLEGEFILKLESVDIPVSAGDEPITVYIEQLHLFKSKNGAKILEVSTRHDDNDVVRETQSCEIIND